MRYQKIHSQIWNDEKFTKLTPAQQRLFLYILTCPHGNIIGFFVLKQGYIVDDLKYSTKDLKKDLEKLVTEKVIDYDFSTSVVLIKKFLKHNPITNPNQIKAAGKLLSELPKTQLIHSFIEVLPEVLKKELSKGLNQIQNMLSVSVSDSVSDSVKKEEPKPEEPTKQKYGTYVELFPQEYEKLHEKFNSKIQDVLDFFNLKIGSKGLTKWRKEHESDYLTILYWDRQGWINTKQKAGDVWRDER